MNSTEARKRYRFLTEWAAAEPGSFTAPASYRGLVAITRELGPNNWIAEALPRADQHTWIEIWRTCEELYRRAGAPEQRTILSLRHEPRERVLVVTFGLPD